MPPCGATVTQNLTYLVQDATTNPTTKVCAYTLCPVSESVNRIRLDFTVCNLKKFNIFVKQSAWLMTFSFSLKLSLFLISNWPRGGDLTVIELCRYISYKLHNTF